MGVQIFLIIIGACYVIIISAGCDGAYKKGLTVGKAILVSCLVLYLLHFKRKICSMVGFVCYLLAISTTMIYVVNEWGGIGFFNTRIKDGYR